MKVNMEALINDLKKVTVSFNEKEKGFEILQYDHLSSIKRDIDLRRETFKAKLDQISLAILPMIFELDPNINFQWKLLKK